MYIHVCTHVLESLGERERDFQTVSGSCVGVYLSRALSFIPFDVLLSVNHGRTDALPLISSSMVKGKHGYRPCSAL